ncbi:MAG: cytochrome P450 [Candidatus Azotimanducaceae bacterium]|jgi:cytochrome P450
MSEAISTPEFPDPYSIPLEDLDVGDPMLFKADAIWPYFERLRKEAPVHYCKNGQFGPYWSITKFDDIMEVEKNHEVFSSEVGGITIFERMSDFKTSSFIQMDPPKHDLQRKTVTGVVAPRNLSTLEPIIRERAAKILDELPIGEAFDWVDRVSIELTTQMLATLFDFPFEDRRKLTYWSDVATSSAANGGTTPEEERRRALMECLDVFTGLWNERVKDKVPGNDLISMMAHGDDTQNMDPMEYLGNLILLIVGGNDTTRNSISGGVYHLNQNPDQYEKLRNNLDLIPNMVSEIIRYQTPLAHMRRTATQDYVLRGKQIKKGDKVIMWYISANRDEDVIDRANEFLIDRERARHHTSFGFGVHRCMGNRLAEMQLRTVWEEIMKRFKYIEVLEEPERTQSPFVKGYEKLMVKLHAW